jgi:hypothetical protein
MQSLRFASLAGPHQGDRLAVRIAAAVAIGVVVGCATSFAQAHLAMPWAALANSASPWLLGGFAAGALQLRRGTGIAAGFIACVLEVVSYYVTSAARGFPVSHAWIAFWAACALVGGPVFGWAGWAWRRATGWWQALGVSLAAGTFLAESLGAYEFRLHHDSSAALYLVIGVILMLLLLLPLGRQSARSLVACTLIVTAVGFLIYGPLLSALTSAGLPG